jgi:hypothetical protein
VVGCCAAGWRWWLANERAPTATSTATHGGMNTLLTEYRYF